MRRIIFVICVFLNIHITMAQETTNLFDFHNFDYQSYQVKLQKFMETLTPQEQIIFVMSQTKNTSTSSKEYELDGNIEDKINEIYNKVKEIDSHISYGIDCNNLYEVDCHCNHF